MSDYATCPSCDTSVKIEGGATPVEQRLEELEERVEENHQLLVNIRDRLASRRLLGDKKEPE